MQGPPAIKTSICWLFLVMLILCGAGCSTYLPPGARADLPALAPPGIQAGFAAQPAAPFPAAIAAVRIQAPGYSNYHLQRNGGQYGGGRYTVIMTREVEDPAQFARVAALPRVAGITGLNRMLLPARLESDREIREAAARLQADLVLLYTFDTAFFDSDAAKPLTVITLGLSPTRRITAVTTVSALLLDTRTGYLYSAFEVTERAATLATSWGSRDAADAVRQETEKKAFGKFIDEFVTAWPRVVARHAQGG